LVEDFLKYQALRARWGASARWGSQWPARQPVASRSLHARQVDCRAQARVVRRQDDLAAMVAHDGAGDR